MPTHAELAGKLLNDAATFFRTVGSQNEALSEQMTENATVFEQMASLVIKEPEGAMDGTSHGELTGRLLSDAAQFFKTLAEQNEPIRDQMIENANVYEQIASLVAADPIGILE